MGDDEHLVRVPGRGEAAQGVLTLSSSPPPKKNVLTMPVVGDDPPCPSPRAERGGSGHPHSAAAASGSPATSAGS